MVWSKRSNRKRVPMRKRSKRMMVSRVRRNPNLYLFKRSYYVPNIISANAAGPAGQYGFSFTLAGVPNASEFTALYDQYKIKAVKIRFLPKGNSSELLNGATSGNAITSLSSVIDYDDATPPTGGSGQLCQYQSYKLTRTDKEHIRYFKPRINAAAINATGGATQNKINMKGWLDCDVSTTEHYGLKVLLETPRVGDVSFDAVVTLYLAFRNVR